VVSTGTRLWTDQPAQGARLTFEGLTCDTASQMDMTLTLEVAAGFLAVAVFAGWRGARPPNLDRGPRLAPWRFIMLLSAAVLMFVLGHLVHLLSASGAD
jgi:hypothetical protein